MSLECPYCEAVIGDLDECTNQEYVYEADCPSCSKRFVFIIYYEKYYEARKTPCLNGEEHNWKKVIGYPEELFKNKYRCEYCEEERNLKKDV